MRPSWQRCGQQENGRPSVDRLFRVLSILPSCQAHVFPSSARRISEATSVSRGDSELHVATVILFSFRWNRPVFPSVSKLNGNHADLGSISRCDKTGRDSIQRYQLLSLSLSLCPFFSSFSGFEIFSRSRNFRRFFRRDIRDIRQV